MQEVKRLFNPEFINRLDEIIIFNSLTNDDLAKIVDLMIAQLNENLAHKTARRSRSPKTPSSGFSIKPAKTRTTARGRCAAPFSATSKIRCPKL